MPRLVLDKKIERTVTLELTEKDLFTLIASLGMAETPELKRFATSVGVPTEDLHLFEDAKSLYNVLFSAYKNGRKE